jgi:hypothetical protein
MPDVHQDFEVLWEFVDFCTKGHAHTHARFLAVDIARLNWKGLCIYLAYTRVLLVWDLLAYAQYMRF